MVEAKKLQRLRERSKSRILVNYTRRFQPSYVSLKKQFALLLGCESLRAIAVRYQRGFLNNATHALDLVQFVTGWDISRARVRTVQAVNDEFSDDPTLSCHGEWNGASLSIVGLPNVQFSLFEIDLFFDRSAIRLRDRGDTIEISGSAGPAGYYAPLEMQTVTRGNLHAPLENFHRHVQQMIRDPRLPDNFDESLKLAGWFFETLKQK